MRLLMLLGLVLIPALASAQGAIGVASGGGGGAIPECSGDQAAFGVCLDAATGELVWEGATADGFEGSLAVTDPTADRTWTLPDVSGAIALSTSATFDDEGFKVCDDGDPTKCAEFETSGIASGITRTYTLPNVNSTLLATVSSLVSGAVGFPNVVVFGNSYSNAFPALSYKTSLTPDAGMFLTAATANTWHLAEHTDSAIDLNNGPGGTSATAAPTLVVHSEDQNTDHYSGLAYYGTAGKWVTTLTESSATNVLILPVADNASSGGEIHIKVFASDGTNHQARYTTLTYVAVNEADTETCSLSGAAGACTGACDETDDGNVSAITSGTLTYTWGFSGGTNACTLTLNAVSSLIQTTLEIEAQLIHVGAGEPLPF